MKTPYANQLLNTMKALRAEQAKRTEAPLGFWAKIVAWLKRLGR